MPWQKGISGNPGGRPKGTGHHETKARQADDLVIRLLPGIANAVGKRPPLYLLFVGYERGAVGGWWDHKGTFAAIEEARAAGHDHLNRSPVLGWFHIADPETGEIVDRYENSFIDDYVIFDGDDE